MNWKTYLFIAVYFSLFLGSCIALLWWNRRRKKRRLPFPDEFRLLRSAGETQLKHVLKFDEDFLMWIVAAACFPMLVGAGMLSLTGSFPPGTQIAWLVVTVVAFVAAFIASARWFARKNTENSNRYLGYFGERIVAEFLEPLKAHGWRVFHDVPFENNGATFNIDHIAVGPGGVYAIETKTRRKGSARPGFDDHKVYFDGRGLVWPWGEDNHGLEQAERNSLFLDNWIRTEVGERVHVTPILVLPGWWVEAKPARETRLCRVMNPKGLAGWLSKAKTSLVSPQIELISNRLETRCRDVEY